MIDPMEALQKLKEFLPLLIPVLLIQWSLLIYAAVKLLKAQQPPKYLPKWAWLLIILFVNILGPVAYLMLGRNEE